MLTIYQAFRGRVYRGRDPYSNIEVPGTANNALWVHSMVTLHYNVSVSCKHYHPPPPGQIFKICQMLESREFFFIKIPGPKAFLIPFNTFYTFPPLSRYLLLSYPINMYKFIGIYMKIQLICIRYLGQMPCLSQIPGQDINLSQMPQGCLGGDCNAWN